MSYRAIAGRVSAIFCDLVLYVPRARGAADVARAVQVLLLGNWHAVCITVDE